VKPLRVGVIGVGHLGQHHARLYAGMPNVILAGVVDADQERAKLIAERHGTAVYDDVAVLLRQQVDAVSIAVPTSSHHAVATQCLQAGAHVLVEKPLALTVAQCQDLVGLAQARRRVLQVGHIERFNPVMEKVRPLVREPIFFECQRVSPFTGRSADVDVVRDLMSHDLDMVLSFHPGEVEDVQAAGAPVLTTLIDVANVRLTFSSGCVANLAASRVSANQMRLLRVFEQDGYITVDYQTRQVSVHRRSREAGKPLAMQVEYLQGSDEEPLKLEMDAFLQAVRSGAPPVVSGEDGTATMALAQRILDAIDAFWRRHASV